MPPEVIISLIIPVYNGEKYLGETLQSAISNLGEMCAEILVINDGSTDRTSEVMNRYSSTIRQFHQENLGESAAVNLGLQQCRGEFALVLSADDPAPKRELFELAITLMREQTNLVCVYPDWEIVDEQNRPLQSVKVREYSFEEMVGEFVCLPGPGSLFRVEPALQIGGRNPDFRYVGDYDFWIRLGMLGDMRRIPLSLSYWRRHSESTSIKFRSKSMAEERINVAKEFFRRESSFPHLKRKAISNAYYSSARLCFFSKGIPARKYLLRSILANPKSLIERSKLEIIFILFFPVSALAAKLLGLRK